MKSTRTLRFPIQRLFLLTLVSFVAVAALLGVAASANKSNRAAKARAGQAANTKSGISPRVLDDKHPNAPTVAVITATLTDNIAAATKVVPGGIINYTAVINNTGAASPTDDATSVQYAATIDSNTAFVVGSAHASPIATNNAYTTVGNTLLEAGVAASGNPAVTSAVKLFDNDTIATAPDTIVLASFTATSANGGTVSVNADGSFTYLPPVGFTGSDTFTYTIRNNTDVTLADTGTVTVTVGAPRVWYVNNSGANGDGRSTSPFNTLANAAAVDAASDIIYIFTGGGNYTGGITLLNNEQVIGNGVALVVNTFTLRAAGARPTVVNAGGTGMTLALNNTLSGFNFGASTGFSIQGTSVGTLAVNNMLINNTSGGALDLTGVTTPTVNVVLDSTTSTGGTNNVRLVGLNGTVTLGSGALSASTAGATNHAFVVSGGGNAGVTFSGSITKANQGNVVNVSGRIGGTITLSGTIAGSGSNGVNVSSNTGGTVDFSGATKTLNTAANAAVTLATNTGATINFSGGGLDIDTTSGAGFNATGGGSIAVTTGANPNTIDTTTGTALNVNSTTIVGGLSFRSISSNGAANGINLNGSGAGALTVTGNGGACTLATQTCTGGSIQSSTAEGIVLNNANAPNLTLMKVQNSGTDGIHMTGGSGFTLTNSIVTDTAGITQQDGIEFDNVGGTITLTSIAVSGSPHDNIDFDNNSTNLTAFNLTNSTIQNTLAGTGADGILFVARGTSVITAATLTGNTVSGNQSTGIQPVAQDTANIQNFIIGQPGAGNGNTINGNNAGVDANQSQSGNITFRVVNNTFNTQRSQVINAFAATASTGGTMTGFIQSNTIGTVGVIDSGSAIGSGVRVISKGACVGAFTIDANLVREVPNGRGIEVTAFRTAAGNGGARVRVTGNTVARPTDSAQVICGPADPCPLASIWVSADNEVNNGNETTCSTVSGNTAYDPTSWANGGESAYYMQENNFTGPATHNLEGTMGTPLAQITNTNTVTNPGPGADVIIDGAVGLVAVGTCGAFPTAPQPVQKSAGNRNDVVDSSPTNAIATANLEPAKALAPVAPVLSKDDSAAVTAKATRKASAGPAASNGRNEVRSHHPVLRSPASQSQDAPNAPNANLPVAIGTLPAGKTITIKYQAAVNSTAPTARKASSQGTVTGSGPAPFSVTTTDPGPPVVSGATDTLIDTSITWTGATNTDWNTPGNWNLPGPVPSTYAPGVSNPAINEVTIPAVATQPTISATDIGIYSLSLANTMTLTITSPRVLTIGGSPGGDLTLDGIISGGNLNLGTGTHVINNAGGTGSLSSTNVATVLSGGTVTLNNNLQAGALAVNAGGSMNITNRTLSLNGSGPALVAPGGATFTTTGSTVIFNGTAAQQAAGVAYNNLTINNTIGLNITGVTLTGNATVNGTLTLTSSDLATGAFTLSQPNTTLSTGVSDVVGTVTRSSGVQFAVGTPLTFGNPNNIITFTAGATRPTVVTVNLAKNAPADYLAAVHRAYTITRTGGSGFTSTVRLHYLDTELGILNTVEANLNLRWFKASTGSWPSAQPTSGLDNTSNWVECNAVTELNGPDPYLASRWTIAGLSPTAADGIVTGRILDANGNPVEGAVVRLNGTQNRKFITDANGVYRFDNVETGGFYTVTPSRANFEFSPSLRAFNQLGQETSAIFTANATGQTANPLDTPEYFVRQHYIDFFGREPDESGFNFWSDQIIECGGDANCYQRRRENVSAAFYLSIEFRKTGLLVDGMHRASYGTRPQFEEFMPDTRTVGFGVQVGVQGWETKLQQNKEAFAAAFVNRPAFRARYDSMDASTFVESLVSNTGVNFTAAERNEWLSGLATGNLTRADVVMSIAENDRFVNAKFNDSFVMMQYFGYLRRNADPNGFAFWLNKLNEFNGNFEQAEMVKAFIISGEFRDRFPR